MPVANGVPGEEQAIMKLSERGIKAEKTSARGRQTVQEGGVQGVVLAKFQTGRVASVGQAEDLDGFRLRIHDPVFGNPEPLVEGQLHPAVVGGRCRGQDLDKKVRKPWMFFSVTMAEWALETKTRSGTTTWGGFWEKTTSQGEKKSVPWEGCV